LGWNLAAFEYPDMKRAALSYPANFPCPTTEGYGFEIDMGLVRSGGNANVAHTPQRQAYAHLPTVIRAEFSLRAGNLAYWTRWMNDNLGIWFNMPLAHPFLPEGVQKEEIVVRAIADSLEHNFTRHNQTSVSMLFEISPTVYVEAVDGI
jgi:hypothetical protein